MRPKHRTGVAHTAAFCGIVILIASTAGCGACYRRLAEISAACRIRADEHHDLSQIRHETRDDLAKQREELRQLKAERDVETARLEAERARLEMEFCLANQEAERERLKSNIQENLESKVAFNVRQGLEVGELEVDVEGLKELMKQREQEELRGPPEPVRKTPCSCCDKTCGCKPGMIRRLCPKCCTKPCEAEQTCGGPEAFTRLQQEPFKQPLRPAEIPMKLPVKLTFGMQQPLIEGARITRQPSPEPLRGGPPGTPCTMPCDHGKVSLVDPNAPMPPTPREDGRIETARRPSERDGSAVLPIPPLPDEFEAVKVNVDQPSGGKELSSLPRP